MFYLRSNMRGKKSISDILQGLYGVLMAIFLLFYAGCTIKDNSFAQSEQCMELLREVEIMKNNLPRQIGDGITLVRAEYIDSVYTVWVEVDDRNLSFEEIVDLKNKRKVEILDDIAVSDGNDRRNYELYVEYNIRMQMIYIGKYSHKQTKLTITPNEMYEALHTKADAYSKLQMLINSTKIVPSENIEEVKDFRVTLQDSIVYTTIVLDEDMCDITSVKDVMSPTEIMKDMREINPKLIEFMANARCGLTYRFIGSHTKEIVDIVISPSEVLFNKVILDATAKTQQETVECDEW